MKIMMIRHLMTPGNLKKCYIGRTDESLAKGDVQNDRVRQVKERLSGMKKPDIVIASPMKRCVETAALLFPGQEPLLCPRMRECDFGLFEGKNYEELKDNPVYQSWLGSGGRIPFPKGEDPEVFKERSVCGFEEMVEWMSVNRVKDGAMVVHGGTIMSVLSRFDAAKREFYSWQTKNGGGYIITVEEEQWRMGKKVFEEIESL